MARIQKVTDMRTGLVHPRRDWDGRFMARRKAAHIVRDRERNVFDRLPLPIESHVYCVRAWNAQAEK